MNHFWRWHKKLRDRVDNVSGSLATKAMWKHTEEIWTYDPVSKEVFCSHMRASLEDCAKGKVWMVQRHSYAKTVWEIENDGGIDGEAQV
jgi:hypothetical protein